MFDAYFYLDFIREK